MGQGVDSYEGYDYSWDEVMPVEKLPRERKINSTYGARGTIQRGAMLEMKCHCGDIYRARTADLKRGWALSCSKSCAAIRRDFGRPRAKPVQAAGKGGEQP